MISNWADFGWGVAAGVGGLILLCIVIILVILARAPIFDEFDKYMKKE